MKLEIGADLNEWLRKLIHSRKFKEAHQNKVVNDGRKFLGEKDVNATESETQASRENEDLVKKTPCNHLKAALSQSHEVLNHVTPSSLRMVIYSTLRAQSAEPTQDLVIRGQHNSFLKKPLSAQKVKSLGRACPSLRQLAIEDVNLCSPQRRKRINLAHFPTTLSLLSIRDSVIEVETFLTSTHDFYNIKVLDLGRSLDVRNSDNCWPQMASIEELYLEGAQGFANADFLETILANCPLLKVLDLEGSDVGFDALEVVSKLAPQIETLFLGFTKVGDSNFFHLERLNVTLRCLLNLCLADTPLSNCGLEAIRKVAPNLQQVTVNGFTVTHIESPEEIFLPLRVRRTCNVHIGALFRNHGCGHFKEAHSLRC